MEIFLWVLRLILPVALLALTLAFSSRLLVRHALRDVRTSKIGDLVWAELISESKSSSRDGKYSSDDFGGLLAMTQRIRAQRWPYRDRGVLSFAWAQGKDGLLHLYVGISGAHAGDASLDMLAKSVGARVEILNETPKFVSDYIALAHRERSKPSTVTNLVEEPGRMASAIAATMRGQGDNERVALIVTCDMMRHSEGIRMVANINEEAIMRGGTAAQYGVVAKEANIMVNDAVRFSIAAGASTPELAKNVLNNALSTVSSTMGYNFSISSAHRNTFKWSSIFGVIGIALTSLLTYAGALPMAVGIGIGGAFVAAIAAVWAFGDSFGIKSLRDSFKRGEVVVPPFWWWSARWKVHGIIRSKRDNGNDDNKKVGSQVAPPSCKQVLTAHPAALYEMVSFSLNKSEDVFTEASRSNGLPSDMLEAYYPLFMGRTGTEQIAMYDLFDLHFSIYAAGRPGSGKSNALLVTYAGVVKSCLDRAAGMSITPIWAETKGSGAYDAWSVARLHPESMLIDVHNPASAYRLSMEGRRLSDGATIAEVESNIDALVTAWQYAYGDGIGARAKQMLVNSMMISMLLDASEISYLQLERHVNVSRPNIVDLSWYILGGDTRLQVGAAIMSLAAQLNPAASERDRMLDETIGKLSTIFDGASPAKIQERTESALNKLDEMRRARSMWSPDGNRYEVGIDQLPGHFAPIVINMGPYYDANLERYDTSIDSGTNKKLLMIFEHLLWNQIKSQCSGWLKKRRYVPVFFDEVADVARDSSGEAVNPLGEALKEGRSYGHSLLMGCQFPDQLPPTVKHAVLSVNTKLWFQLPNPEDQKLAVENLSSDGSRSAFTRDSIREMTEGTCAMTMKRRDRTTPPFTLKVPHFETWRDILFDPTTVDVDDAVAKYIESEQRTLARANA